MPDDTLPDSRRDQLWEAAAARGIPLLAILATVGVVVVVFLAGKLIYKLREIILLMVVAGFIALLLNPVVVLLQRWKVQRRGLAVAIVTVFGVIVFAGLAALFGYPLVDGLTHLTHKLPDLRPAGRARQRPPGPPLPALPRPAVGGQEPRPQALDLRQEPLETGPDTGQGGRQPAVRPVRDLRPRPPPAPRGTEAPPGVCSG